MGYDPKFQENDVIDYSMREKLSKMSIVELDKIIEEELEKAKKAKKAPKFSEM